MRLRLMRRPQRWIALREHPLPRRTPRARLPDCEALVEAARLPPSCFLGQPCLDLCEGVEEASIRHPTGCFLPTEPSTWP